MDLDPTPAGHFAFGRRLGEEASPTRRFFEEPNDLQLAFWLFFGVHNFWTSLRVHSMCKVCPIERCASQPRDLVAAAWGSDSELAALEDWVPTLPCYSWAAQLFRIDLREIFLGQHACTWNRNSATFEIRFSAMVTLVSFSSKDVKFCEFRRIFNDIFSLVQKSREVRSNATGRRIFERFANDSNAAFPLYSEEVREKRAVRFLKQILY